MASNNIKDNGSTDNSNNTNSSGRTNPKPMTGLKVAEVAEQRDVGRKIARIDQEIARRLNVSTGDALELSSLGKKTAVLNWPARESDRGKGLIRYRVERTLAMWV